MTKVMKAAMVAALVMVSAAASAQFSVNAGYVNSKSNVKDDKAMNGITAGVGYDMNIQGGFGLGLGLNYTYSWYSEKQSETTPIGDYTVKGTVSNHTLDVPVRLTYTYEVSDNFKVFGFAGPKFVYAIAGNYKTTFDGSDAIKSALQAAGMYDGLVGSYDIYGDNSNANRFDIKAGLGVGANISNFLVKVGYDWGLLDATKKQEGETNHTPVHVNQFYVTLGYAF